jgi:hypothetical protein
MIIFTLFSAASKAADHNESSPWMNGKINTTWCSGVGNRGKPFRLPYFPVIPYDLLVRARRALEWNCGIPHYGFSAQMHTQGFQTLCSGPLKRGEAPIRWQRGNVLGPFLRLLAGREKEYYGR